jgi:hypothetical protein
MDPASIINFLSNEDTQELAPGFFIDQHGITIFWPWSYSPHCLEKQNKAGKGLGHELDFRIEKNNVVPGSLKNNASGDGDAVL